jgi:hypothetical protein
VPWLHQGRLPAYCLRLLSQNPVPVETFLDFLCGFFPLREIEKSLAPILTMHTLENIFRNVAVAPGQAIAICGVPLVHGAVSIASGCNLVFGSDWTWRYDFAVG